MDVTEEFYITKAQEYLSANGVASYMHYVVAKLKEEKNRAQRYLEIHKGCTSVSLVSRKLSEKYSRKIVNCSIIINKIIIKHLQ